MRFDACSSWLGAAMLLMACAGESAGARAPVVYGTDDRMEVHAYPGEVHRDIALASIAMKISARLLDEDDPSDVRITYTRTLGEARMLCEGEPFADQIEPGTCSGTLIDDRHILTAGHCVDEARDCDGTRVWVLGFLYEAEGVLRRLTSDDVYRCARIVVSQNDEAADFALVELDRPVVGHARALVRRAPLPPPVGTPLVLIGHPNGIPMKIASGATLNRIAGTDLWSDVDAFSGNSGSGVFDASGELVALLQGGATDYVDGPDGCRIVNRIATPSGGGEHLVAVQAALAAFCATPSGAGSLACDCSGDACTRREPGDLCAQAEPLGTGSTRFDAQLAGYGADETGTCGGAGPDRFYTLTIEEPSTVIVRASGFDTVIYLRDGCEGAELACNDDRSRDDAGSLIDLELDPGTYVLAIDAYGAAVGEASVIITIEPIPVIPDAGTDAGIDAGPAPDPDAGSAIDAGTAPTGAGCGCRAAQDSRAPVPIIVPFVLAFLFNRRSPAERAARGARPGRAPRRAPRRT